MAEILPAQLKIVAPGETYNIGKHPESAALTVSGGTVTVSVTLTSPLMRETIKTGVVSTTTTNAPVTAISTTLSTTAAAASAGDFNAFI